jgi:hypothetical protein
MTWAAAAGDPRRGRGGATTGDVEGKANIVFEARGKKHVKDMCGGIGTPQGVKRRRRGYVLERFVQTKCAHMAKPCAAHGETDGTETAAGWGQRAVGD